MADMTTSADCGRSGGGGGKKRLSVRLPFEASMHTTQSLPGMSSVAAMSAERWARVKQLFLDALACPAEERAAFLAVAGADDDDVRRVVECFLGAHQRAESGAAGAALGAAFGDRSTIDTGDGGGLATASSLRAGTCLGPYEIAGRIGCGAMGEVYRARDRRGGRLVAIKVLPRPAARDSRRLARFEQEARAASALCHANIVAVHDTGWHEGLPFMVTELLEGEPLDQRLSRGPLPLGTALDCAVQIAGGLAAAHERGIVHRDVKPANLFLTADGQVKILDFGLAKLTASAAGSKLEGTPLPETVPGMVLGTPGYMSPEQVRADRIDIRSDQFSLGCVMYELMAGQSPFRRATAIQTMAAILDDEPRPVGELNPLVPRPVASVVARCLAKQPDRRYPSTGELARELARAVDESGDPRSTGVLLMMGATLLAAAAGTRVGGCVQALMP